MKHYDLIVAGGGLTGVAAAVSAARENLKVLLIEASGNLGGALSNAFVYPFMPYRIERADESEAELLSAGIFAEMCERHEKAGGVSERGWQPEIFKIILDDMVVEAGVDILFHTKLVDVVSEGRNISAVRIAGKEGIKEITSNFFVDTTGDGDLMAMSGCDYQLGRESDNLCQPMTTCFRLSGVDVKKFKEEFSNLQKLYNEGQNNGKITNPRENILVFYGIGEDIVHFNTTRVVKHNPVNDIELSRAEIEARRQVLEMYDFLRENSESCKNSIICSIANEIGVRESRKLKGVHILTADELKNLVDFEDSIALGRYPIDIHNPEGKGTFMYHFKPGEYYKIPFRSLVPIEKDNLLVAGRCLSATHEAHSAVRIMPICACLGQAAGVAIAEAVKSNTNVHTLNIKNVQQKLIEEGARIK